MSRILLSAYACEPGKGSEPEVGWMWATELAAAGHEVWVITRAVNRAAIESSAQANRNPALHFVYFDLPDWLRRFKRGNRGVHWYYALWQWGAYRVARRLTRCIKFDRVHHVTFVGLRAPSFMGLLGVPFVLGPVSGGESVPRLLRSGMSRAARLRECLRDLANLATRIDPLMRHNFRTAERILLATPASRALVPQVFHSKCEVQLGVGLSRDYLGWTGPRCQSGGPALRLLYAGRLLEWKGVDLALRAVRAVLDGGVAVRFTIVGRGPAEPALRQLAADLALHDAVRWLQWLPQSELQEQYSQHDALLFPSLRDSGGMVVLEALAHGLPVVCTDCGGPGTIVTERCGRVVATAARHKDEVVVALAEALSELAGDRALLKKLGRAARTRAWDFDFHHVVTRVHPACIAEPGPRDIVTSCIQPSHLSQCQTTSQLDWRAPLPLPATIGANHRRWARRTCQAVALLPLFCLLLLPEYVQGLADPDTKSILYRVTIGPLRLVDVLLLAIIFVHAVFWAGSRRLRIRIPKPLALPATGFVAAIAMAMLYGALHGGTNLYFDWRALALGIGMYTVFAVWLPTPQSADFAVHLFATFMALRIAWILADFFTGGGDLLVGVRIPVFDGPTLSAVVFTALLSACLADVAPGWPALFWMSLSTAAYLLVLLSFRRTFWTELGLGTLILLLSQRERRGRKLLLAIASLLAVAALLGPAFYHRVQSMDFTRDETEFSQGNPDHVGEVLDAWEQVQRNPVMGIGLGRSFQTLRIQDWKEESVMVHNAPLHVWLKYGLLGLVCYSWFHLALFRWLWRQNQISPATPAYDLASQTRPAFLRAALAFLAAQFVVSLGFTPWPYSSLQSTILIAFLLAVAKTGDIPCTYQPYPSSLPR